MGKRVQAGGSVGWIQCSPFKHYQHVDRFKYTLLPRVNTGTCFGGSKKMYVCLEFFEEPLDQTYAYLYLFLSFFMQILYMDIKLKNFYTSDFLKRKMKSDARRQYKC